MSQQGIIASILTIDFTASSTFCLFANLLEIGSPMFAAPMILTMPRRIEKMQTRGNPPLRFHRIVAEPIA